MVTFVVVRYERAKCLPIRNQSIFQLSIVIDKYDNYNYGFFYFQLNCLLSIIIVRDSLAETF